MMNVMALLEGLAAVDWSKLHHAYGSATDVPGLLRALVSPDEASEEIKKGARANERSVLEQVTWILWGNVFHQGTVWQASPNVIPFLLEILEGGPADPELRVFLLSYLHHLALGYPADRFPEPLDPLTYFADADGLDMDAVAAAIVAMHTKEYEDLTEDEVALHGRAAALWAKRCFLAVEAAAPGLARFIDEADDEIALEGIALAASFPRAAAAALSRLRTQAAAAGIRAGSAVVALAVVAGPAATADAERALASPDQLVALHGACAAVLADPERVSTRAVDVLTSAGPELTEKPSPLTETVGTLVARCFPRLSAEHRVSAVEALARQHVTANPLGRVSLTSVMLRLVLGDEEAPADARALSPLQRRAMETIRDHGGWRVSEGTFVNYTEVVRGWGLPSDPEAFARWLGSTPGS